MVTLTASVSALSASPMTVTRSGANTIDDPGRIAFANASRMFALTRASDRCMARGHVLACIFRTLSLAMISAE